MAFSLLYCRCVNAREKYKINNLIAMNGIDLGFKANTFDAVYCFQVIEHIPETEVIKFDNTTYKLRRR